VITEVRVSESRGLNMGETADWRNNVPMDMTMEMPTEVTSIVAGTTGEAVVEPMEGNEIGHWRRCEVSATAWALGDLRRRMWPAPQLQARELAQLHRCIAMMANMLETETVLQAMQW
jgi:hypothetical protein